VDDRQIHEIIKI